jgi:hypothetical protein
VDLFLRQNMDWLARAVNWAKFSATASLGVIHKGHIKNALVRPSPSASLSLSPWSGSGPLTCVRTGAAGSLPARRCRLGLAVLRGRQCVSPLSPAGPDLS